MSTCIRSHRAPTPPSNVLWHSHEQVFTLPLATCLVRFTPTPAVSRAQCRIQVNVSNSINFGSFSVTVKKQYYFIQRGARRVVMMFITYIACIATKRHGKGKAHKRLASTKDYLNVNCIEIAELQEE